MENNNLPVVLQFVKDAQIFNLTRIEFFCAFPQGTISRAISGSRPMTTTQLRKLTALLKLTGIGPEKTLEEQLRLLEQVTNRNPVPEPGT